MSDRRLALSPGHVAAQVSGVRRPLHPGLLERGAGTETRLQVHPGPSEADAARIVSGAGYC